MLFAQLSHAMGLNDVCDWLRLKSAALARFGVTPPSKNGLSNANKERSAEFAEKLFWSVLGHLQHASPNFAAGRKGKGLLRRFKVKIHAVDSTVIQLVANCMDWAYDNKRSVPLSWKPFCHPSVIRSSRSGFQIPKTPQGTAGRSSRPTHFPGPVLALGAEPVACI